MKRKRKRFEPVYSKAVAQQEEQQSINNGREESRRIAEPIAPRSDINAA